MSRAPPIHEIAFHQKALPPVKLPLPTQKDRTVVLSQWFEQARHLHLSGNLADAGDYYAAILRAQPGHVDAKHLLGVLKVQEGRLVEAQRLLRQVIAAVPGLPPAHVNLGDALRLSGKLAEALQSYERAIALNPLYPEAHVNRGLTLSALGRQAEAVDAFSHVLDIKPGHVEALNNRGNALVDLGRHAEALADYDRALLAQPHHVGMLYNRGNVLRALGRAEDALESYDRALTLMPDMAGALNNRGNLLRDLDRPAEALADFDRVLAMTPGDALALNNRGNVLRSLDRPDEALESYRRAVALVPGFASAHNNIGDLLAELGRLDEAEHAFRTAISLDPAFTSAWLNLTTAVKIRPGDPMIAAMSDVRGRLTDPVDLARIDHALGKSLADTGEPERAFQHYMAGAAARRSVLAYDEAATLAMFDAIKRLFTPDFIASWAGRGDAMRRPIFILGMPRSGTSLVEQIIASHPDVHGAGELTALNAAFNPVLAPLGGFPNGLSGIDAAAFLDIAARYSDLAAPPGGGSRRVTDKMPLNFLFVGLIHLAMPGARILHTVRNATDTCLSCFMQHFTAGHEFTNDQGELGRYYRAYEALMAHWRGVLPAGSFLDVRYEDVVGDLEGEARRMLAYCGLDWNDECLAFHRSARPVRTASLAQVRQPIYTRSVERWRAYEPWLGPLLAALRGA